MHSSPKKYKQFQPEDSVTLASLKQRARNGAPSQSLAGHHQP